MVGAVHTGWDGFSPPTGAIVVEQHADGPVAYLRGDVDGPVVQAWETEQGMEAVVLAAVDVSAMSYIDSTGLSFLVRWAKDCAAAGRPAVLRGVSPRFDQVLDLIGARALFVREE
jgi:phospholipid transport system transporter-binding protein